MCLRNIGDYVDIFFLWSFRFLNISVIKMRYEVMSRCIGGRKVVEGEKFFRVCSR